MMNRKKGLLVVSFGTSYADTRKVTIEAIEQELALAFPEYTVYRAWTSKMIINKLKITEGLHIHTVDEAVSQMIQDGITDVLVQPTHILNGVENDLMKDAILAKADAFSSISIGDPMLTSSKDAFALLTAVIQAFPDLQKSDALVLVGHGTSHYANSIYAALNYMLQDMGYANVHVGTVEAYPTIDNVLRALSLQSPAHVFVAPLMIVAGDHANNDIGGEDEDSWVNSIRHAGYPADAVLKGLGEYPGVRRILVDHARRAARALQA